MVFDDPSLNHPQLFIVLPEWLALLVILMWIRFRTARPTTVSYSEDMIMPSYSGKLLDDEETKPASATSLSTYAYVSVSATSDVVHV